MVASFSGVADQSESRAIVLLLLVIQPLPLSDFFLMNPDALERFHET
jgi:hypothetical protein